jgi:hypothetical protein
MSKRYEQLIPLIQTCKPRCIVEVGVHKAKRSVKMCEAALKFGPVHYIGYDVFDTMGAQFQAEALNGKGPATEAHARDKLNALARVRSGFTYELIVGDTRNTLHGRGVKADFAFIDGDHRAEVIEGDYLALHLSPVIVLDDYYVENEGRMPVDLAKHGANSLVGNLRISGHRVEVFPVADWCNAGPLVKLAVVFR